MQYAPTSSTAARADAWKNPGSLGFSTWQRHMAISLAGGGTDTSGHTRAQIRPDYSRAHDQKEGQRGLGAIYDRHASFASNLIARQYRQADSPVDAERFTYALPRNKSQRSSYGIVQSMPSLSLFHRKQNPGLSDSPQGSEMISRTPGGGSNPIRAFLAGDPSSSCARPLSSAHRYMRPEGNIPQAYKRNGVMPAPNAEPGSVPGLGISHPGGNLSLELVRRRTGNSCMQSYGQTFPLIPLVSESTNLMPRPAASILGHSGDSHNMLPRFAPPIGQRPGKAAIANRINRKEIIRDVPKAESILQTSSSGRIAAAAEPSTPATPRFTERFSQGPVHDIHSAGVATHLLPLDTGAFSLKASPLSGADRAANRISSLTADHRSSIALTHADGLAVSARSFSVGTSSHFVLQRAAASSRSAGGAEDTPALAFGSTQGGAPDALPEHMQSAQLPPPMAGEHAKRYQGYKATRLPAVQRLAGKGPFAAHRKTVMAQAPAHSFHGNRIEQLSRLSARMQKKADSPSTAEPGPYNRSSPRMQWPHISPEIGFSLNSSLPFPVSRRPIASHSGGLAVGNHAAISDGTHMFHRLHRLPDQSIPAVFIKERTGNPEPRIADRSFPAMTGDTSPNASLPGFFSINRQADIADVIEPALARSLVAGQRRVSTDSHASGMNITSWPQSRPLSIGFMHSSSAVSLLREMLPAYEQAGALSRFKPLVSPRSSYSMTGQTIARSAQQQRLSISGGQSDPVPETQARNYRDIDLDQMQSNWKPGSEGRPLAVLQRAQDKLLRASGQGGNALASPGGPEERHGLVSPASEAAGKPIIRAGHANEIPEPGPGEPDADETAEHVWRIMAERLVIEQERRGLAKWP